MIYDPPSGWMYGFPKPYKPLEGETLAQTLIRDGYPTKDAEFASKHCRFLGTREEIESVNEKENPGVQVEARSHSVEEPS